MDFPRLASQSDDPNFCREFQSRHFFTFCSHIHVQDLILLMPVSYNPVLVRVLGKIVSYYQETLLPVVGVCLYRLPSDRPSAMKLICRLQSPLRHTGDPTSSNYELRSLRSSRAPAGFLSNYATFRPILAGIRLQTVAEVGHVSGTRWIGVSGSCGLSLQWPIRRVLLDALAMDDGGASGVGPDQEGKGRPAVVSIDADGSQKPFSASVN